jgi:hypothetical protein
MLSMSRGAMGGANMTRATDVFIPEEHDVRGAIRARRIAENHFLHELSNDPDEILRSMKSTDPLFTTILRNTASGNNDIFRCRTIAEQREFYRSGREHMDMTETPMFTSIGADWYGFVHGMTTSRIKANGTTVQTEIIGLLPSTPDEDTIAGEIGLSMPIFGKQGDEPGTLPLQRVETLALFQQWFAALQSGDADQVAALYADRIQAALFDSLEGQVAIVRGKEAVREHYSRLFAGCHIVTIELVLRLIDRWYIMAELLWNVSQPGRDETWFRTTDILVPTPENEIVSQLGIGTRRVLVGPPGQKTV